MIINFVSVISTNTHHVNKFFSKFNHSMLYNNWKNQNIVLLNFQIIFLVIQPWKWLHQKMELFHIQSEKKKYFYALSICWFRAPMYPNAHRVVWTLATSLEKSGSNPKQGLDIHSVIESTLERYSDIVFRYCQKDIVFKG